MAENKKSFIAYADWKETFDSLPNEVAGKLIKHIFAYVNDENPETDDFVINAVFANIKQTLKRDLTKWETQLEQRKLAGKRSAEIRATKSNERSNSLNETTRNPTDNVSVSVSDNVNLIDINKSLLSEIKISDDKKGFLVKEEFIESTEQEISYFKTAESFRKLFIKNLKEKNAPTKTQETATFKNYVTPIRLMVEKKEATIEQLRDAYNYLGSKEGEFWKTNILSTEKLRKNISMLLAKKNQVPETFKNKNSDQTDFHQKRKRFT
jgi:hypothetical protein